MQGIFNLLYSRGPIWGLRVELLQLHLLIIGKVILLLVLLRFDIDSLPYIDPLIDPLLLWWGLFCCGFRSPEFNGHQLFLFGLLFLNRFLVLSERGLKFPQDGELSILYDVWSRFGTGCKIGVWHALALNQGFQLVWLRLYIRDRILDQDSELLYFCLGATWCEEELRIFILLDGFKFWLVLPCFLYF